MDRLMALMRNMAIAFRALLVTITAVVMLAEPASAAVDLSCEPPAVNLRMPSAQPHHETDHGPRHQMKGCCVVACALQGAIAPNTAFAERRADFVRLNFSEIALRLTDHTIPPAFEPPRSTA
ncbi:MAG: hypothetical protein ACYC10_21980 [Allorhizobium sp.]